MVESHQTSNLCNMTHTSNIRDAKKAFNQALYRPTAERKANAVKLLQALITQVNEMEEVAPAKPKAKRTKRKTKRMSKNTKLEVQAQRVSRGTAQTYISPKETKVKNGKKMTYDEYVGVPAEVQAFPEYAELREAGYSVEDAVRYVRALADGAPEAMEVPFNV